MKSQGKIAIVDDDEDLLRLLISAFQEEGFEVKGISTGKEAVSYLTDPKNFKDLSLIILDRILPDMDGLDILKEIQNNSAKKVPVLILSILTAEKDVLKGLKGGAIDYIGKPFSLPILIQKARSLIGK